MKIRSFALNLSLLVIELFMMALYTENDKEIIEMVKVSYASAVDSLMNAQVYTLP